jgi:DNA-binding ferritin-like protein
MNIEIVKISPEKDVYFESSLDSVRNFGIILNKTSSIIKMLHWFIKDYNTHKIFGDLYSNLIELFDNLEEEIIGTSKKYNVIFPSFNSTFNDLDNIQNYKEDENIIELYHKTTDYINNILTSIEFNDYVTKVKSGLNNTKEEIISNINKTNYLLDIIKR